MTRSRSTDEAATLLGMIGTGLLALGIGRLRRRLDEQPDELDESTEVPIPIE